jgi:hypothetical protein
MPDRNQLILDAVKLLATESKCSNFKACVMLSAQLKHFKSVILRRIRFGNRPCYNELEEILLAIFDLDDNPPMSAAFLDEIVLTFKK